MIKKILPYGAKTLQNGVIEKNLNRKVQIWLKENNILYWNTTGGLYGFTGIPDIIILKNGKVCGIELKTDKGVMRDSQKIMKQRWENELIPYLIIRPNNITLLNEIVELMGQDLSVSEYYFNLNEIVNKGDIN